MNLKSFVFAAFLALFAMPVSAQNSDDFFSVGDEYGGTRDAITYWTATNGIGNNGIGQSEAPVGSGLLILTAVGAGYAISRRKRNFKKGAALLLALALTLGFTQCKKKVLEPIANNGNTVHITLTMADGGSKVDVNPTGSGTYATVAFEKDDIIYVGNGNKYVGYVTYNGTDTWEGDLTSPTTDDYLHLYFLGNKAPLSDVTPGTTTEFSVSIADQASKYPVISYNHTLEKYNGEGSYTATTLYNKCSIMKFNVTTPSTAAIYITGMNNKVTVNFANPTVDDNGFSYSVNTTDGGLIKMPAKDASNITWAIVLPQEALAEGAEGSAYTNGYIGNRPAISKIERNHYYAGDGIAITVNTVSKIKDLSTLTENWTAEDGWTLTGTLGANVKISIADGATVTLNGVSINASGTWTTGDYAGINCIGDATIILADGTTNTVKGFDGYFPGIWARLGYTLTIKGTGSLVASSNGWSAGIGGGGTTTFGNIRIEGGNITATGGNGCAGIGAGGYDGGDITITGGYIQATGYEGGAGIGGGYYANCGAITISGGTIIASSDENGTGIGSGIMGTCGDINISGGTITATGGESGAGIGAGDMGTCGDINISGGSINANGGNDGAGIGIGNDAECGDISISGGAIEATGIRNGAGIGCSGQGTCGNIEITSGVTQVTATKGINSSHSIGFGLLVGDESYIICGTVTIGGTEYYNGSAYENDGDTYLAQSPLVYLAP